MSNSNWPLNARLKDALQLVAERPHDNAARKYVAETLAAMGRHAEARKYLEAEDSAPSPGK